MKRKGALKRTAREAGEEAQEKRTSLAALQAVLKGQQDGLEYATKEEAARELDGVRDEKTQADRELEKARQAEEKAGSKKTETEALLLRWRQELPELKKELTAGKEEYETALKTGGLSEKEWKNLTETWSGEDAKKLQAGLDAWEKKKTAALSLQESAKKAVEGKEMPVPEALEAAREEAKERLERAGLELETIKASQSRMRESVRPSGRCLRAGSGDGPAQAAGRPVQPAFRQCVRFQDGYRKLSSSASIWNRFWSVPTGVFRRCPPASLSFAC